MTTVETKIKTKTAILLVNLGTPDSYKISDIRKYLNEFLSDPRVIDINPIGRFFLVKFAILPTRPARIAPLYQKIWLKEGSPLLVHGLKLKEELQKRLGDDYVIEFAMRYQNPSLKDVLNLVLRCTDY